MKRKNYFLLFIILLVLISGTYFFVERVNKIETISYKSFVEELENNQVERVILSDSPQIKAELRNGERVLTDNPRTEDFKKELLLYGVRVEEAGLGLKEVLIFLALTSGLIYLVYFFKNKVPKEVEKEMSNLSNMEEVDYDTRISFKDVAGNEEAKESLKEMVDFIKNPEVYNQYGAKLPMGVLL